MSATAAVFTLLYMLLKDRREPPSAAPVSGEMRSIHTSLEGEGDLLATLLDIIRAYCARLPRDVLISTMLTIGAPLLALIFTFLVQEFLGTLPIAISVLATMAIAFAAFVIVGSITMGRGRRRKRETIVRLRVLMREPSFTPALARRMRRILEDERHNVLFVAYVNDCVLEEFERRLEARSPLSVVA